MSTVAPKSPAPRLNPVLADSEQYIDEQIRRTRRSLKLVDFAAGMISLLIALLAFLLATALLDHWVFKGGLPPAIRGTLFAILLVYVVWHAWQKFVPLFRSINPVYAAHAIEQTSPSLKNSLLNLLLFRTHRTPMSARVYHALEQQAAQRLSTASLDGAVDHSALLRLGYALVLVIAVCAAYSVLSPKNLAVSAARVLAPWADLAAPSRVQILDVTPGDSSVARGERLAVSAEIRGAREDEPVRLRYSTADGQLVDESLTMTPTAGARFEGQLPRGSEIGGSVGVQQDLEYWIEAGDARTRRYKLTVFSRPTLVVQRVRYEYPTYTGIPTAEVDSTGDLHGIEGTRVTLQALANQPIKSAYVDFDGDGQNDVPMSVEGDRATASFTLGLRPDRRTPLHPSYVLRLTTTAGRKNGEPAQYRIEVTPDYAPEVRITRPEEPESSAHVDEITLVGAEARDPDFALSHVRIVGKVGDRDITLGDLLTDNHDGRFTGAKPFTPSDVGLKAGDLLEYWAEATDNRRPQPNVSASEHRRLRITGGDAQGGPKNPQPGPAGDKPQQDKQSGKQQDGGQQQGGGGGETGEGDSGGESDSADGDAGAGGEGGQSGQQDDSQQDGDSQGGGGQGGSEKQGDNQAGGAGEQRQNGEQSAQPAADPQAGEDGAANPQPGQSPAGESAAGDGKPDNQAQPNPNAGDAASQSDEPQSAGESAGGEQSAKPSKVSADGDDDGTAFDRIKDHFAEQDANNQPGQAGEQDQSGAAQQAGGDPAAGAEDEATENDRQSDAPANAENQPGSSGKPQADGKQAPQDAPGKDAAGQPGREPGGDLANEPPPKSNPDAPAGDERRGAGQQMGDKPAGKPDPGDQQQPSPESGMNRNQGNPGSGNPSDEDEGSPHMDEDAIEKRAKDKQAEDNSKSEGDKEPPSGSSDKRESDSRGGASGDASGGGQQGAGQHADAPGKGNPGQNEASDQGAGQADEPGPGEAGDNAGDQQQADGKTGKSSGDKPGDGSESGSPKSDNQDPSASPESDGKLQPGATSPGPGASEQKPAGESEPNDSPSGESDGEAAAGDSDSADGERGDNQPADPADSPADKQPGEPGAKSTAGDTSKSAAQQPSSRPDSSTTPPESGGGTDHDPSIGPDQPNAPEVEDAANIEFARQQTDLILDRLDHQLAKKNVDEGLLDNLGWNQEQLQRFVDRWKGLKTRAGDQSADADDARRELDAALRSLGLRRQGPRRISGAGKADKLRDLNEGYRARAPIEYADRVRRYMKNAAANE